MGTINIFFLSIFSCNYNCAGDVAHFHQSQTRETRRNISVSQTINCLYCSRKIYNACDKSLKQFVIEKARDYITTEGRLNLPLELHRQFRCDTCTAIKRTTRVDLRCRAYAVSNVN